MIKMDKTFLEHNHGRTDHSKFIISLDPELVWGVRDLRTIQNYGANILGAREAILAMLSLFQKYQVRVTLPVVGTLLFDIYEAWLGLLMKIRPLLLDAWICFFDKSGDYGLKQHPFGTSVHAF